MPEYQISASLSASQREMAVASVSPSTGILGSLSLSRITDNHPRRSSSLYSLPCVSLPPRDSLRTSSSSANPRRFCHASLLQSSFFGSSILQFQTNFQKNQRGGSNPYSNLAIVSMSMEAGIGIMGTKLGMMTYFEADGNVVPVTVVGFREGNVVTQVKTTATDGYDAVQIGYRRVRDRKLTKPELGHLSRAGTIPLRHLQEFRLPEEMVDNFEPNQRLQFGEIFSEGDLVDVSGKTIGKGFQGGIKRHNFRRGPMTHGSKSHRALGSIGAGTTPGHVYKGKKMAGRMGGTKTKIRKLKIVKIDNDLRVLMIKGAVP